MSEDAAKNEALDATKPPEPEPPAQPQSPERPVVAKQGLGRWLFAAVPALGLLELVLHVRQTTRVVSDADWDAAKGVVASMAQPDDLVLVSPHWLDQVARWKLGSASPKLADEARPDDTRFSHAVEVSIRGEHAAELDGWKMLEEKSAGMVTVRRLENPSPAHVIDDLLAHMGPDKMRVSQVDASARETPCIWGRGAVEAGNLGWGPAKPGERWSCPGTFVGITVLPALDYTARRCFYAPPPGGPSILRIRFPDVTFGYGLHGHHGIYVEAERHRDGAPVTLAFRVGDRFLGSIVHQDGQGWRDFELNTGDLAGQKAELTVDITSQNANRRMYCFEADTR